MIHRLLIIVLVFYGLTAVAYADDLNMVTVPIASQSQADIHDALGKAFINDLIKVSGNEDIGSLKEVKGALPSVEKFVQQYRFTDAGLEVIFNTSQVANFLKQLNLPNSNSQAVQNTWLAVMNITSLETYQNLLQELYKLNMIVGISTKEVGSQGVLLRISTNQDTHALKDALDKDPHFASSQPAANQLLLSYRWVP